MGRQRGFNYECAHEHYRCGMREAFPPLLDLPAQMRAALADLDLDAARPVTARDRLDAIARLAEDEKRDAKTTSRTGS